MKVPGKTYFYKLLRSIVQVQTSHPLPTVVSAFVLAGLAMFYTVTHLEFKTSQYALISPSDRLIQSLKVADRFSGQDAFVVAVENRENRQSLEFVRALAPRLEADTKHFAQVFSRVDPTGFRRWSLLYLGEKELTELNRNLNEHASFIQNLAHSPGLVTFFEEINREMTSKMVSEVFTGFLDAPAQQAGGERMNLDFLLRVLREMKAATQGVSTFTSPWSSFFSNSGFGNEADEGYFWTEGKKYLLVFVEPKKGRGAPDQGASLTALRQAVAAVRAEFPNIQAGVTGQAALDEDEKSGALKDMALATNLSLAGLTMLLVLFWRTVRRPLLQMAMQVVSLSLTFGLTTLIIGHLNLLSVTFAPMVVGLGDDYNIHWFSRYNEERRLPGRSRKKALRATMENIGPAILLAALSTCLAFFPLALTGFKGLAELGIICGMGLVVASATTVCLLPALILLFDKAKRGRPAPAVPDEEREVRPLVRMTRRRALVITACTIAATGLSLWGAEKVKFDLHMLHLQSKTAESVIWETKLIEGSKYPSIYGAVFARSLPEVAEKTKALEKLPTVSKVQSITNFFPQDQDLKIPLVRRMKPLLNDIPPIASPFDPVDTAQLDNVLSRIRFKMQDSSAGEWGASKPLEAQMKEAGLLIDAIRKDIRSTPATRMAARIKGFEKSLMDDLNDKVDLLRQNAATRPMIVSDLPEPVRKRFMGEDLYLIRVFPAGDIWEPQFLRVFVRDIRSVDPDATGDPITLSVFTRAFRDSSVKAAVYSLAFIFVFLFVTLRNVALTLAAIAPLAVGAVWTFGLMYLFGVDLNLANTIFLPLVIGAGVEYGVIIVQRWRHRTVDGEKVALPFSTGTGVLVAGLSTTIGFGSLMISRHQGIHSLGLLSTIGSLTVLAAALLSLPALLYLLPEKKRGSATESKDGKTQDLTGTNEGKRWEGGRD